MASLVKAPSGVIDSYLGAIYSAEATDSAEKLGLVRNAN